MGIREASTTVPVAPVTPFMTPTERLASLRVARVSHDELVLRLSRLLVIAEAERIRLMKLRTAALGACDASALRRLRRAHVPPVAAVIDLMSADGLHQHYSTTRDPLARDRLVELHAPLAHGLASRFLHRGEATDDLQQVALLALVKAVERFEPARGLQFSTFATPTVLGELKRHFRDKTWTIRPPRRVHDRYLSVQRARDDLTQELGRSPKIPEVAVRVGASVEEVLEALEAGDTRAMRSLDTPPASGDDRDLSSLLGALDEGIEGVERSQFLERLLARLTEREREVVDLRFFSGLTQGQIAEKLGTNQMHVSRLLGRSLRRMRALAGAS